MEEIKEIVKFISKKKLRHIETFNLDDKSDSVYRQMYYLILKNENISEDELADEIAGTLKSSKKYGMIKSRFKKRLFNHILFLDLAENLTEITKIISAAYKNIYIAKLLQINSLLNASYYMVKKALPTIQKHELLEPLLTAYQIKLNHHTRKGQIKKVENISEDLIKISNALTIETKVLTLYEKAGLLYSKSEILNYRDTSKMTNIISLLNDLLTNKDILFKAKWTAIVVINEYAIYSGDYINLEKRTLEAEKLLHQKPHFNYKVRQLIILVWRLTIYETNKETKKGLETVKKLRSIFEPSNINWFYSERKILFYYTNISNYDKAYDIIINVLNSGNFKNINIKTQEMWMLWHAYIAIIKADYDIVELKKINIYKTLNSVNKISQDKTGLNTLVKNLEILFRYLLGDIDSLIDMENSLAIYNSRYLKPNKLRRAQVFFKMIITCSKEGFSKNVVKKNGEKAIKKLDKLKNDTPEKRAFEFLSYETIIKLMVNKKGTRN